MVNGEKNVQNNNHEFVILNMKILLNSILKVKLYQITFGQKQSRFCLNFFQDYTYSIVNIISKLLPVKLHVNLVQKTYIRKYTIFADDTIAVLPNPNELQLELNLEHDFKAMLWLRDSGLLLNADKMHIV